MRSEGGATLLCWPRDAFLLGELQQLVGDSKDGTKRPSIIEGSWLARTPLAALVDLPHLASCLRPTTISRLQVAHARGAVRGIIPWMTAPTRHDMIRYEPGCRLSQRWPHLGVAVVAEVRGEEHIGVEPAKEGDHAEERRVHPPARARGGGVKGLVASSCEGWHHTSRGDDGIMASSCEK